MASIIKNIYPGYIQKNRFDIFFEGIAKKQYNSKIGEQNKLVENLGNHNKNQLNKVGSKLQKFAVKCMT